MNVSAIFSTLGSNTSLVPIATKDGIESISRVNLAYREGAKESKRMGVLDAKERFIEETTTSLFWLGGIPLLKCLFDKFATNKIYGFDAKNKKYGKNALANINIKLLDQNSPQALKLDKIKDIDVKNQVKKVLDDPNKYKKIFATKSAVSTLIPLALVGWILPKLIFAYTDKTVKKQKAKEQKIVYEKQIARQSEIAQKYSTFSGFLGKYINKDNKVNEANKTAEVKENQNPSFKGTGDGLVKVFTNPVYNMAILDGGIMAGRVTTARKWYEAAEITIKEIGIITFMYLGGPYIAKGLEKLSDKFFKKPIELDSKILENSKFTDELKKAAKNDSLLEFTKNTEESIIKFIDKDLKKGKGKLTNLTLKVAEEMGIINIVDGARNPLKYIETDKVAELNKNIKKMVKGISTSSDADKFIKTTKNLKRASVVANIGLCCVALAYLLPKAQYWFRNKFTKSSIAPGLRDYYK